MNIFEKVKNGMDLVSVAEYYAIPVSHDFTNCIFHNDTHPSMKLYKDHYHCFSCGAHGDVVSFASQLFGLSPYKAAQKLVSDFNITKENCMKHKPLQKQYISENEAYNLILGYVKLLEQNRDKYRPCSPDEELHPLYVESVHRLPVYEYYLDIMITGSKEERNNFIKHGRRLFYELRKKLRQT